MLQIISKKLNSYYSGKNRWWLPLIAGLPFFLCLPPFNHEYHPFFTPFPFLTFAALVPLFYFSTRKPRGRAVLHTYLFGFVVACEQVFWLFFVKIEGLWLLILIGMVLAAAFLALFYLAAGMAFRWCYRRFPGWYPVIFPACWILIDYSRTRGELTFPWGFLGYSLTPLLPVSQVASLTGVWGLTFIIVLGNLLLWGFLTARVRQTSSRGAISRLVVFIVCFGVMTLWGWGRMQRPAHHPSTRIALVQPAMDQLNWGINSLDSSITVTDSLVHAAADPKPDLIVGPESALLCFLARQRMYGNRVHRWADSVKTPIILGSIHWDRAPGGSVYDYLVYNTAFLIKPGDKELYPYRKIKLVPFSEAFPFEADFPILSRVNLGEADFQRGREETVYSVNDSLRAAPFICYEIIYPSFVQKRLRGDANLIVHITNDGWFGRSTGPYQHAMMTRMRAIENNVAIARCAITGLSMFIDPNGRVLGQTKLYERTILRGNLPLKKADTFYARHGDWVVMLCAVLVALLAGFAVLGRLLRWVVEG